MDSVIQLLRLAYAGGTLTLVQAQRLYARLIWIFVGAIGIILVGWLCNLAGWRGVSIGLSLVFTVLTIIVWFEPVRLALVAGVGAVAGATPRIPGAPVSMAGRFLSVYIDILGKVLLWGSVLLFILGTVPFGERPSVIFGITAGLLLLVFIQWQWKIGTNRGKRLFHWYVSAMIVSFAISLVPGSVWVKYMPFGWNPKEIGTSSTEEAVYRLDRTRREMADADRAKELERITDKVRRREALTQAEEHFIAGSRRQSEKPSTPPARQAQTQSGQQTLWMPAGGMSARISIPVGVRAMVRGDHFRVHNVYPDGHECIRSAGSACPDAPQIVVHLENEDTENPNTVSYYYVPI